ncbi:hypothetical protein BD413DRAFT_266252 [Trametes elegans]|nr:hypothetical protein BD413DRAFT_266252 [Trametes elegans]
MLHPHRRNRRLRCLPSTTSQRTASHVWGRTFTSFSGSRRRLAHVPCPWAPRSLPTCMSNKLSASGLMRPFCVLDLNHRLLTSSLTECPLSLYSTPCITSCTDRHPPLASLSAFDRSQSPRWPRQVHHQHFLALLAPSIHSRSSVHCVRSTFLQIRDSDLGLTLRSPAYTPLDGFLSRLLHTENRSGPTPTSPDTTFSDSHPDKARLENPMMPALLDASTVRPAGFRVGLDV